MTQEDIQKAEKALNTMIEEAAANGGHVYIVDRRQNNFSLRLREPIRIHCYTGFKGDSHEE